MTVTAEQQSMHRRVFAIVRESPSITKSALVNACYSELRRDGVAVTYHPLQAVKDLIRMGALIKTQGHGFPGRVGRSSGVVGVPPTYEVSDSHKTRPLAT